MDPTILQGKLLEHMIGQFNFSSSILVKTSSCKLQGRVGHNPYLTPQRRIYNREKNIDNRFSVFISLNQLSCMGESGNMVKLFQIPRTGRG